MNSKTLDQLSMEKQNLEEWMKEDPTHDPALFWAGRMSARLHLLSQGSTFDLSDQLRLACAFSDEYDEVIFSRTK